VYFATWTQFVKWFTAEYDKCDLEEGATECGPYLGPTADPGMPPWKAEWFILYPDSHYIRATENYYAKPRADGGGGYRKHFSFHYGPTPPLDANGTPQWRLDNACDLRIDCDRRGPHLHYGGQDHIPQSRIGGMQISDQGMFDFVRKIQEQRNSHASAEETFGFRVEAAA
jgi:hypothetical protein